MFAVVRFADSDEVDIISSNWILDDKVCAWPPYKSRQLKKALLEAESPSEEWRIHDIDILGLYNSYGKALQKCTNMENTGNGEENDSAKKRKIHSMNDSGSEHSDSSLPLPSGSTSIVHLKVADVKEEIKPKRPRKRKIPKKYEDGADDPTCSKTLQDNVENEQSKELCIYQSEGESSMGKGPISNEQIFKMLLDIKKTLNEHTAILKGVFQKEEEPPPYSVELFSQLPVKSMEDLDQLERIINADSVFKKIVQYLGNRGGYDVSTVTRMVLKFLMNDEVASNFNWAGRGGKLEFRNLKLRNVVICAVRMNAIAKSAPNKQIEDCIKNWLKYAPIRIQQRAKKDMSVVVFQNPSWQPNNETSQSILGI